MKGRDIVLLLLFVLFVMPPRCTDDYAAAGLKQSGLINALRILEREAARP